MQRPCAMRTASSSGNVGATAAAAVGTTSSLLARISERRRPMRSESGPQIQAPTARAAISTETVRPDADALTPNARPSSGRIACVEYIVANIADDPSRNGPMPPRRPCEAMP